MGRPKKVTATSTYVPKKVFGLDGTFDILSEQNFLWDAVIKKVARISRVYGFNRVETPFLEDVRLYENFYKNSPKLLHSLVTVEMAGNKAALRSAFLPSVLRAYYQYRLFDQPAINKWFFSGPAVTAEEDGKQINSDFEFGFEVFGNFTHLAEAQVIGAVWELLKSLGLKDLSLEINNIGQEECQNTYENALQSFLSAKKYELCDECNEHLTGRVLNVFRCDNLDCQAIVSEAPTVLDFLDQDSHKHFTSILEALDELSVPYQLNPYYAGPDGHSKTNIVVKAKIKGETEIVGEGGYHEQLMQNLCGKNITCFGFSGSAKKIYDILDLAKTEVSKDLKSDVFLVPLGDLASKRSLRLFRDLTTEKISVYDSFGLSGVKNQLKQAEMYRAPIALIMGQKEAADEMVILRDVKSGMQEVISYDKIVEEVKKRLGK